MTTTPPIRGAAITAPVALLPVATIAEAGCQVLLASLAASTLPRLGLVALGMAVCRTGPASHLPFAADDHRGLWPGRA